jgi:hypothetical protein
MDYGMIWSRAARFLHEMVYAIDFIMPRASMPMIVTGEIENARPLQVEGNVLVFRQLVEEMAGISAFISPTPVVGATHVRACADALLRPSLPKPIGITTDGNDWRCVG